MLENQEPKGWQDLSYPKAKGKNLTIYKKPVCVLIDVSQLLDYIDGNKTLFSRFWFLDKYDILSQTLNYGPNSIMEFLDPIFHGLFSFYYSHYNELEMDDDFIFMVESVSIVGSDVIHQKLTENKKIKYDPNINGIEFIKWVDKKTALIGITHAARPREYNISEDSLSI